MAASPEDDYQEHQHRSEHQATRNQIAMAQYECFQRIVTESTHKTTAMGEERISISLQCLVEEFFIASSVTSKNMCLCTLLSAGTECNTTWDGWLCWDETEAGVTAEQSCPDYYYDFDPHGKVLCHLFFSANSVIIY